MAEPAETLGQRLRLVRGALTQVGFAARLGADKNTIGRYERGERQPDADFLCAVRSEFDISVDWLLTGEGPVRAAGGDRAESAEPFDEDLMAGLVDGIVAVYREENVVLPPPDLGRLAARMHADLAAAYDDPYERRVAVRGMLAQLRRDLREAPVGARSRRRA